MRWKFSDDFSCCYHPSLVIFCPGERFRLPGASCFA